MQFLRASVVVMAALGGVDAARGGVAPDYDFQWATIGAVGNEPWRGPPFSSIVEGRGSVGYEYRISKLELTTGQYLEFFNTFAPYDLQLAHDLTPGTWGATDINTPHTHFELRTDIPNAAMVPLNGISWRAAAMYCNWLHNGKATGLWAIQNGAYDTSTFGEAPDESITDQPTHSPGAKFWIPTLDEWLKSAHYDPSKGDDGGWWLYPTTSDTAPVPGRPGEPGAQTGAGLAFAEGFDPVFIPLGSYPDVQSPWGLLDCSGGASEWTEFLGFDSRGVKGSASTGESNRPAWDDQVTTLMGYSVDFALPSLRVASTVPSIGTGVGAVVFSLAASSRRRRSCGGYLAGT